MGEVWKDIKGYEKLYQVSNLGRVKSLERTVKCFYRGNKNKKEIILKQNFRNFYLCVGLNKDRCRKIFDIHRLVAINFIRDILIGEEVDHIDRNKINNNLLNLRICTHSENQKNRLKTIRNKHKIVLKCDLNNNIIEKYKSISDASKSNNRNAGQICKCCNNKIKQSGGFIWKYEL